MIDIAVRLLDRWAKHPTHGINVIAQGLPRATLSGPDDPAPPILTVCNDSDDAIIAEKLEPPKVPAFMVWGEFSAQIAPVRSYKIARDVLIMAGFVTAEDADAYMANRASGYILRAGLISLARFNSAQTSEGYRELNGLKILELSNVTEQRITAAFGNRKMWGALEIHATLVETIN